MKDEINETNNVLTTHVWEYWENLGEIYHLGSFSGFDLAIIFICGYLNELPIPDDSFITIIDEKIK